MEARNMARAPKNNRPTPANDTPWAHPIRVADLAQRTATSFALAPSTEILTAIAADLDLSALKKLRFEGKLTAKGKTDWQLDAKIGATVVQPCVVSLAPVTTRIDLPTQRSFIADHSAFETEPDAEGEVEMDADESREPLPAIIDLGEIMIEALALALPLYPRAPDATLEDPQFSAPGVAPMKDEDTRPFAGLANLLKTGDKPDKE
jgi:uncharacterized metal-binding protein YceD (DUF177 family)